MAYASKYYNLAKAHEYYMKHRQLKGRKKKTSTADLSDAGKIAAKEVKEQLQAELKAALKKVKRGNTAERKRLRELFQQKYEAELDEIHKDASMLKAPKQKKEKQPKQKAEKAPKAAKSSSAKSSSKSTGTAKATTTQTTTPAATTTQTTQAQEQPKTESEKILDTVNQIKEKLDLMTDEQKAQAKVLIESLIEQYKKKLLSEVNNENG